MSDLFTWEFLATMTGLTLGTVIVTNVIRHALGFDARWVALAVSAVLSVSVWVFSIDGSLDALALALVNAFVVYAAATGSAQVAGGLTGDSAVLALDRGSRRRFWGGWW